MVFREQYRSLLRSQLPDVLVVGVMKAGTTSVVNAMCGLSSVTSGRLKEPAIFAPGRGLFTSAIRSFANFGFSGRLRLDGSTEYAKHDVSSVNAAEISRLVPDSQIIFVVRDPVARLISHVRHDFDRGRIDVATPLDRLTTDGTSYVGNSRYLDLLAPWLHHFPDRVTVVRSDLLFRGDDAEKKRLLAAVAADPTVALTFKRLNEAGSVSDTTRARALAAKIPFYHGFLRPLIPTWARQAAVTITSRQQSARWVDYVTDESILADQLEPMFDREREWLRSGCPTAAIEPL